MTIHEFKRKYPNHEEEVEERAGIMQYSGEMSKQEAERKAVGRMRQKYRLWFQNDLFNGGGK